MGKKRLLETSLMTKDKDKFFFYYFRVQHCSATADLYVKYCSTDLAPVL